MTSPTPTPRNASWREAIERFGRIDTLINNAGIYIGKAFTDYTLEDFNTLVAVNLAGFFHITTRTIRHMLGQDSGHVVNVSTTLVEQAESARPAALPDADQGRPGCGRPDRSRSSTPPVVYG